MPSDLSLTSCVILVSGRSMVLPDADRIHKFERRWKKSLPRRGNKTAYRLQVGFNSAYVEQVSITGKIYKCRKRLGMTQAELAEKTGLSESALRSYELGNRMPKPAHREAIAKALGINPKTLDDFYGEDVDATIQCLMGMETNDMRRPVLIDGIAYLMPIQADMETSVREWAEKQLEYACQDLGDDEYSAWKDA